MSEQPDSVGFAAHFLRENDRDRYLSTLVLPVAERPHVQALLAFNADVATVRDRVREPAPGEIRLQWWVDMLAGGGHGDVRRNPLADALQQAIDHYRLPTLALERLLAARRFDLYDDPMPDLATFEGYAGETTATLYQLAAMMLNDGRELASGDAAGHLGVAHALIGHLRAFGYNASRGRLFLPLAVLERNGVTEAEIFSGKTSEGVLAAYRELSSIARDHLARAAASIGELPSELRPAFAMISLLSSQLGVLERHTKEPFAPPRDLADWRKIAGLVWWNWRAG